MSRLSKFLLVTMVFVFMLACNFVTQPIRDVQNIAGTAESLATALPIETLQALPSVLPMETLEAIPSIMPNLENFNFFDPQGTPASEWKGIPIMPQATAGQEFNGTTYSFKADANLQEARDYYNNQLVTLGWNQTFNMPGDANGAILVFSKDSNILTITISSSEGVTVVILTLA